MEEELRSTYTDAYDAAAASHMGAVMSTNPMPSLGSHLAPVTTSSSGLVINSFFSVVIKSMTPSAPSNESFFSVSFSEGLFDFLSQDWLLNTDDYNELRYTYVGLNLVAHQR